VPLLLAGSPILMLESTITLPATPISKQSMDAIQKYAQNPERGID
jgi:hypothetical protein